MGARRRSGITLTEILIAIMILGVGLVSLATLFPIGLLRLRDATRYSRSAFLIQTAAADATARGLFNQQSFVYADLLNYNINPKAPPYWYPSAISPTGRYNPLIQDTGIYGTDPFYVLSAGAVASGGPGLPFAYDPLWRFQTGLYLDPGNVLGNNVPEARFGSGIGFIRNDSFDNGRPSAHGLQRITNFNLPSVMPVAASVPNIFVSQEDVVWTEAAASIPTSPILPDLSISRDINGNPTNQPTNDWRYSWMFTGQLTSASNASNFDGNIVIFENRPFGITKVTGPYGATYQVEGETVVEAVYGYSTNVIVETGYTNGYGSSADRTVLLRWPAAIPDPVVRVGDWIADVTYERAQPFVISRFFNADKIPGGVPNKANKDEWDNLPAQRCFWYQIQKVVPPSPDPNFTDHRSMTVYVNQSLQARTLLNGNGNPVVLNAALIAPNVINVIPQTIFVR